MRSCAAASGLRSAGEKCHADATETCQHKEVYDRFEKILEGELEKQLATCGWAVTDFHREVGPRARPHHSSCVFRICVSRARILEHAYDIRSFDDSAAAAQLASALEEGSSSEAATRVVAHAAARELLEVCGKSEGKTCVHCH